MRPLYEKLHAFVRFRLREKWGDHFEERDPIPAHLSGNMWAQTWQLIYPLVVRKIVGVPPIVSILALIIGGKLAGFIGLIISVPIAAALMELVNDIEKSKLAKRENGR